MSGNREPWASKAPVKRQQVVAAAAAGLAFIGLGCAMVVYSRAATSARAVEAESGQLDGKAATVVATGASGGSTVSFGMGGGGGDNCAAGAKPPAAVSQSLTLGFCDDFSGTSINTAKWSFQSSAESDWSSNPLGTGNPANQQLEFDQPANCSLSGGILHMTAKRQAVQSQSGTNYTWTSCMINSSPSYAFRYGYLEEKAQFPPVKGFWPALWTWGADGVSCAGNCETDVYEYYSDNSTKIYLTQRNGSGGGCDYNLPFNPTTGMHTYGADIEPTGTTWYIDGVKVCQSTVTAGGNSNILVDNFVYSVIPPDADTAIGDKLIDYVRAWK